MVGTHVSSIEVADSTSGVAVDSQNNIYVSGNIGGAGGDSGAWKVTPGGTVTKYYNTSIDIAGMDFNRDDVLYAAAASRLEKVDTSGTIVDVISTGHAFGHFVAVENEPIPVDTNSTLSFESGSDVNSLVLNMGIVPMTNSPVTVNRLAYSISNLASAGVGSSRLTSITSSGDTDLLFTDIDAFLFGLEDGHSAQFASTIRTGAPGIFQSSYELTFTDDFGGTEVLNLKLHGVIQPPANDPAIPDLIYNAHTGDVSIEPAAGGSIIGYNLRTDDAFLPGNHTPVLGGLATAVTGEISEATFGGISSVASIGNILPAGLSIADVYDTLDYRDVSTVLGGPLVDFDIRYYMCAEGDADCDSDVDVAGDILPAFTNFTGPGSFGRSRTDGDVGPHPGGDGDVDVQDLLLMFANFSGPLDGSGLNGSGLNALGSTSGLLAAAEAGDANIPDLIYDAATGEVTLDVDGSGIIGYVLKNGDNSFAFGNHLQILAGVKTSVAGELSEAAFASSVGANSIGNVFPSGMDLAALTAYLTVNDVSRSLGAPVVPFDLVVLSTGPVVPEPATLLLGGFGFLCLGLIAWRRRSS